MSENDNKMMNKVQALLNKAEATDSAEEAQSFREAADRIMNKYRITEAMLAMTREAQGVDDEPEVHEVTFADSFSPLIQELFSLAYNTAEHTGCRFLGFFSGRGYIVGFGKDVDYAQMMYTTIRQQLLERVDPKVDVNKPYDYNVYKLHEAGIKWESIAHLMNKAKYNAPYGSVAATWDETPWVVDGRGQGKKDGGRLVRAAKRYCRDLGIEYVAIADPKKFRRSYAEGFAGEIGARLREMRRRNEAEVRSTGGAEVALRSRADRIQAALEELEKRHGIHKSQEDPNNKKKAPKYKAPKTDWSAYDRGLKDGKTADLGHRAGDITDGRKAALEG